MRQTRALGTNTSQSLMLGDGPVRMKITNGPMFVFETMPWLESASIGFFFPFGSGSEPLRLCGITHFIEHLFFKGTQTKSPRDIALAFEGTGGMLNASTGKEFMDIYGRIGSRYLKRGFNVIADMILNPRFLQSDIDKERGVIIEEIRMSNDLPDQFLFEQFATQVWGKSSLARPIAGDEKSLFKIDRDAIMHWFTKNFVPSRVVISVAGSFNPDSVIDWWIDMSDQKKLIHPINGRSSDYEIKSVVPKWHRGVKVYRRDIEQATVVIGFPAPSSSAHNRYVFTIIEALLGGGMGARLFQEIREKLGLTYDIESGFSPMKATGVFTVDSVIVPKLIYKLTEKILIELRKIKTQLVKKTEFQRVKELIEGSTLLGMESSSNRMMRNGISQMYLGEIIPIHEIMNKIERVTIDDVMELANEIFTVDNLACGILVPEKFDDDERVTTEIENIASSLLK